MTDREKLIDILKSPPYGEYSYEEMADNLIAKGVTVRNWISVDDERKPRHLEECLCVCVYDSNPESKYRYLNVLRWYAFGGNGFVDRPHFSHEGTEGMLVTHWMPLPKLPKMEANT